jgi:branched-chain amino acid aminotransferase
MHVKAWINGQFVDWEKATVPILSHSFGRGSAIFEVLDIVPTGRGPAFFGLKEHMERLYRSAELVYMELPLSQGDLTAAVAVAARENAVRNGLCKIFAYYPAPELTIMPLDPRVDVAVFCADFDSLKFDREALSAPVAAGISPYRKLDPAAVPVHAKSAANYMNAFLAKLEASRRGFGEVLLLDTAGCIAEGATSNIFFVKKGTVVTPTLRNILAGVTRRAVMEACRSTGIPVEERDVRPEEIPGFDEAFYSGSVTVIEPVKSIEDMVFAGPCPGPVTVRVKNEMIRIRSGGAPEFSHWLTYF